MKTNEKRAFKAMTKQTKRFGSIMYTWDLDDRMLLSDGHFVYVVGKAVFEAYKEECFKGITFNENKAILDFITKAIIVDDTISEAYQTTFTSEVDDVVMRLYKFKNDIVVINQAYIDIAEDLGYSTYYLNGRANNDIFFNLSSREVLQGWFVLPINNSNVKQSLKSIIE